MDLVLNILNADNVRVLVMLVAIAAGCILLNNKLYQKLKSNDFAQLNNTFGELIFALEKKAV